MTGGNVRRGGVSTRAGTETRTSIQDATLEPKREIINISNRSLKIYLRICMSSVCWLATTRSRIRGPGN